MELTKDPMDDRETTHHNSPDVRHSFVVRVWREEGRPGWKGWVQHAHSGESLFVRGLDELLTFIEDRTGKLSAPAQKGLE